MKIVPIIDGLTILATYDKTGYGVCAEHDQIWAGPEEGSMVSEADKMKLVKLGWFLDEDVERWSAFV